MVLKNFFFSGDVARLIKAAWSVPGLFVGPWLPVLCPTPPCGCGEEAVLVYAIRGRFGWVHFSR